MSDLLKTVLSYVERPEEVSSPVMVIANQDDYPKEAYVEVPTVAQVEHDARELGQYLGKQEQVSNEDVDLLVDILLAVSQLAFDTENALVVDDIEGQPNDDISKFFENTLEFVKIFILQPMVKGMREFDVNSNVDDFRKICDSALELWSETMRDISGASIRARERLREVFENIFAKEAELTSD